MCTRWLLSLGLFVLVASCGVARNGAGPGSLDLASGSPTMSGPGGAYDDLGVSDAGQCLPGMTAKACASPSPSSPGCGPVELCEASGAGNGLDDNCDGKVDELCTCTPGEVERCFVGPPKKRMVGGCTDGMQTCIGGEIGYWGDCKGSIGPGAELCDGVDNDCNGCVDDGLCCDAVLACPTSVPDAAPYSDVSYMGSQYFHGTATTWKWTVTGGPCDQLFATTTGSPPQQSFTLTSAATATPKLHFTLSGDYTITMTVTDAAGQVSTCTWVQHVAGPGVRFELCWDTTGFFGSDLDLHVHRPNSTTPFFTSAASMNSGDDCNYRNCNASPTDTSAVPSWSYSTSPLAACSGGPEGFAWTLSGSCRNPRLDIDNVVQVGVPENINIDAPRSGETFRAMVHYFSINSSAATLPSHPLVNIYCGGRLKTTYGQAPDVVPGFARAGAWAKGDMWRVADVTPVVDAAGVTTDCTVTGLHPVGTSAGYRVGHDDKISYNGD